MIFFHRYYGFLRNFPKLPSGAMCVFDAFRGYCAIRFRYFRSGSLQKNSVLLPNSKRQLLGLSLRAVSIRISDMFRILFERCH